MAGRDEAPVDVEQPDRVATGEAAAHRVPQRIGLMAAALLGALTLLYLADLFTSRGEVPPGVTVGGIPVGGLDRAAAEQRLRTELGPRLTRPVVVRAAAIEASIDPAAGLSPDWPGTVTAAGTLNPWTRLRARFASRAVSVRTRADPAALTAALDGLRSQVDRPAVEGTIRFDGILPVAVEPVAGQALDVPAAIGALVGGWTAGVPVVLPVAARPTSVTPDGVRAALDLLARPAVAAPVTVTGGDGGEGDVRATLTPAQIAAALHFRPDGQGGLTPVPDAEALAGALQPELARTEAPGRDASLSVASGTPVITPSVAGRGVDYDALAASLPAVLRRATDRTLAAGYGPRAAGVTTEQLSALGIREVIGEFTLRGFATDAGRNIRRAAEQVDGAIVAPGATFSLNGATGPRDATRGYVEASAAEDGRPGRAVGGGISGFATTLYNAAYFAGLVDVEHTEHSHYLSRYPVAREATVSDGAVDLRFRDEETTGVFLQTLWTPSEITVRLWGSKRWEVTSATGPRTRPLDPPTRTQSTGSGCHPSTGTPGFTATDTRTRRDVHTGEVRQETHTVSYLPQPTVACR